jgi:acyl dehydratase
VQAGRKLVERRPDAPAEPVVLGKVRALKYGRFVTPGSTLRVEVSLLSGQGGVYDLRGEATVLDPAGGREGERAVAASGRFTLRPVRLAGHVGTG